MQREWMLAGTVVVVVLVTLVAAIVVPGALADRTENEPEGEIRIEEISIGADRVGGERLDLSTDVRLAHSGGISENVTVELRAVGLDSGLVETSRTVELGAVDEDGELAVEEPLTVQRGGDYRVEAIVYQNGVRQTTGSKSVRGTAALTPGYPASPVQFHRFTEYDLPVIEYTIQNSDDDSATLGVDTYLTNSGDSDAENLRIEFKARQVESGIVATEREVTVDTVSPSRTTRPGTELTVPSQYNYYLDAILWKDGVIVDTARAGATLDPSVQVPENVSERDVELQVGDFDSESQAPTPEPELDGTDGDGAGFGVGVALVALLGGALLARYKNGGNR